MTAENRYAAAFLGLLLLGLVSIVSLSGSKAHAGDQPAADSVKVQQGARLMSETVGSEGGSVQYSGAEAAAASDELADGVPLPEGGTLRGIQWRELDGFISRAQAQEVIQYNAACQWYTALRDGREVATAHEIVQQIPQWSALRGQATGELADAVARDAAAGGGEALTGVLQDCDAAHARELSYLAKQGG